MTFVSEMPTKVTGHTPVLLVTSRGLCCCDIPLTAALPGYEPKIVAVEPLADSGYLASHGQLGVLPRAPVVAPFGDEPGYALARGMNARQANYLQELVGAAAKRISTSVAEPAKAPPLDGAYFMLRLLGVTLKSGVGSVKLRGSLDRSVPEQHREAIGAVVGKNANQLTRFDLASLPEGTIANATGLSLAEATSLRLNALGFPTGDAPHPGAPSRPTHR